MPEKFIREGFEPVSTEAKHLQLWQLEKSRRNLLKTVSGHGQHSKAK